MLAPRDAGLKAESGRHVPVLIPKFARRLQNFPFGPEAAGRILRAAKERGGNQPRAADTTAVPFVRD
jgi:hypothetical protein